MRFACIILGLGLGSLSVTAGAETVAANITNTCGEQLRQMMIKSPDGEGQCTVEIKAGARQVVRTFRAEMVEELSADGRPEAKVQLLCETCNGPEGPTSSHAIDFVKIAQAAEDMATSTGARPAPGSLSNDCQATNDAAAPTSVSLMECRLNVLRSKTTVPEAEQYYLKLVQSRLQKLAVLKDANGRALFEKAVAAVAALPIAQQSPNVRESLLQFGALLDTSHQAAAFEQQMKTAGPRPDVRADLTRRWQAARQEVINVFANRSRLLKSQGYTDQALLANSDVLLNVVKTLGFPDGNQADAVDPNRAVTPRTALGQPGMQRPTPSVGINPPPRPGGGGGAMPKMFHPN